ncbi:MAG: DNA mismatch repair protein MutS [Candidatus Aminicenantes bacterium]|nr:MAG: DNA mismatch repair protein MutS [Candidatus Aminicenantes bacterium]
MANKNSSTPMMEQYHRIKKQYQDALLFFRLGDFYEMFFEDAKTAAPVLEIALTSRQKVPMCGIPYHAAHTYLVKLLRKGFKVAICEQVEDAKQARGVVKRDVVKVLTPGTAVELELEEEKENTYIASLFLSNEGWGMSVIDLASGEMRATQGELNHMLVDEIFKVFPKEIIYPDDQANEIGGILARSGMNSVVRSPQEDWIFDLTQAKNLLLDHFQVKSLDGFGLGSRDLAVSSSGALMHYLKDLRKDSLSLVHGLSFVQSSQHMILDATSIKNLELTKNLRDGRVKDSLLDVIDFTVTSMGGRLLRYWLMHPLLDKKKIDRRLETVDEFLSQTIARQELRSGLKDISDLERLTGKISLAVANAKDLVALKRSLLPLPQIQSVIRSFASKKTENIQKDWDNAKDIVELIERAVMDEPSFLLTDGGIIKQGYNRELDELREISLSGKTFISQMERKERERTGIPSLKIRYNKVFGYYIDVTKPNLHLVSSDYIRKQTLVNSERFITPELKEYEEKVLNAEQKIGELEYQLFVEIREKIAQEKERLQKIATSLALLDVLSCLAELASQRSYKRPRVNEDERLNIVDGRHPVIEVTNDEPFIPNDTLLDREANQVLIVTGPNMGGKSTYLRQVALICILAQMGSFVPAFEAEIGLVDRVFTRIGAMDFLSVGQSTFMVEMLETANILNNATNNSLILLDEIGRGTSTFDGLSIAWAVAEYLHDKPDVQAKTLFATHYHELTELELTMERIKNYHVSVKEWKEDIIFLRKIVPGASDQSYGIHVARLAGIPHSVIERAREILFNLEKQELDDAGLPRIAYGSSPERDKSQFLLFQEDRNREFLEEMKQEIESWDLDTLSPLEALNLLSELKAKIIKKKVID